MSSSQPVIVHAVLLAPDPRVKSGQIEKYSGYQTALRFWTVVHSHVGEDGVAREIPMQTLQEDLTPEKDRKEGKLVHPKTVKRMFEVCLAQGFFKDTVSHGKKGRKPASFGRSVASGEPGTVTVYPLAKQKMGDLLGVPLGDGYRIQSIRDIACFREACTEMIAKSLQWQSFCCALEEAKATQDERALATLVDAETQLWKAMHNSSTQGTPDVQSQGRYIAYGADTKTRAIGASQTKIAEKAGRSLATVQRHLSHKHRDKKGLQRVVKRQAITELTQEERNAYRMAQRAEAIGIEVALPDGKKLKPVCIYNGKEYEYGTNMYFLPQYEPASRKASQLWARAKSGKRRVKVRAYAAKKGVPMPDQQPEPRQQRRWQPWEGERRFASYSDIPYAGF